MIENARQGFRYRRRHGCVTTRKQTNMEGARVHRGRREVSEWVEGWVQAEVSDHLICKETL